MGGIVPEFDGSGATGSAERNVDPALETRALLNPRVPSFDGVQRGPFDRQSEEALGRCAERNVAPCELITRNVRALRELRVEDPCRFDHLRPRGFDR